MQKTCEFKKILLLVIITSGYYTINITNYDHLSKNILNTVWFLTSELSHLNLKGKLYHFKTNSLFFYHLHTHPFFVNSAAKYTSQFLRYCHYFARDLSIDLSSKPVKTETISQFPPLSF
jgi:hypothetical protein